MKQAGLIEVGDGEVRLTQTAKEVLKDERPRPQDGGPRCRYDLWFLPVAKREFIEVYGIAQISPTERRVEYVWKWKPINSAAASFLVEGHSEQAYNLKDEQVSHVGPHVSVAMFRKYDDGWHVDESIQLENE